MKKIVCLILTLFIFTGCGMMNNTPTKKVEQLLGKYQTNDKDVIKDLNNVLMGNVDLTNDERNDYREFMKKHYQDMTYKIKEEKIDGDSATVDAEVTVHDYSKVLNDLNDYRLKHKDEFDDKNTFASYRLKKLKKSTDSKTYTIRFYLTKTNDEWKVNPLSGDDESKLNGLFGVSNTYNQGDFVDQNNDKQTTIKDNNDNNQTVINDNKDKTNINE